MRKGRAFGYFEEGAAEEVPVRQVDHYKILCACMNMHFQIFLEANNICLFKFLSVNFGSVNSKQVIFPSSAVSAHWHFL